MNVPDMVRAVRRERRLSQRELATRSGVRASTIARIESGATPTPSLALLERIIPAGGYALVVVDRKGWVLNPGDDQHGVLDRGGRRYPAHLPIFRLKDRGEDWWGGG